MKKRSAKISALILTAIVLLCAFAACAPKADSAADLTGSKWVLAAGEDQGYITFSEDQVSALFIFEGAQNASLIQGSYTATDTALTVDDPNTGNKVEFVYEISGDTLSITSINGTAVSFQYNRK